MCIVRENESDWDADDREMVAVALTQRAKTVFEDIAVDAEQSLSYRPLTAREGYWATLVVLDGEPGYYFLLFPEAESGRLHYVLAQPTEPNFGETLLRELSHLHP